MTAIVYPNVAPGVAPLRGVVRGCYVSGDGTIWNAPTGLLPLSTSANASDLIAALAAMGLTLTRSSVATVQTSLSTVVTSGIIANVPRVGDGGYGRGLVVEETRVNYNPYARSQATTDGWSSGTVTYTAGAFAGPDGTMNGNRQQVASGNFGRFRTILTGNTTTTVSLWRRSGTNVAASHAWYISDATSVVNQDNAVPTTWGRSVLTMATPGGGVAPVNSCDGRTLGPPWNLTAGNRDVALDLVQAELGKFATEAIVTTGAAAQRQPDILTMSAKTLASCIRNGRVAFEFVYIPKYATADMISSGNMLFSQAAPTFNRVYLVSTGAMLVRHNGAAVIASSNTFSNSAFDMLSVYFEFGGNAAPYAAIRKNFGARTVFAFPAGVYGNVTSSTPATLFSEGGLVAPTSCWIVSMKACERRPSWAA